jgi:glucose-6-phosphate 1-dehydrogenase
MESGKRFARVRKEIVVTFRHPAPCLCSPDSPEHAQNRLFFRLEPNPGIAVQFWSKIPGPTMRLEQQVLGFQYKDAIAQYTEEYAKLLLDALAGNQTWFVSSREVRASWQFVDPILRVWARGIPKLRPYTDEPPVPPVTARTAAPAKARIQSKH